MIYNHHKTPLFDCNECLFKLISSRYISSEDFIALQKSALQLRFKKGETILKQGAKATHIAFLSKGMIKLNYENETAKNLILTISTAPNLLGGANMFNEGTNIFSITAIENCEVCLIEIEALKNVILKNSAFALQLFELVSKTFKDSIFNFISLAHKQVNGRVADIFIYLSKSVYKSEKFILSLSRKELAEFAGCSQENVIHTLSRFDKDGIMKVAGKNIEIVDMEQLLKISKVG